MLKVDVGIGASASQSRASRDACGSLRRKFWNRRGREIQYFNLRLNPKNATRPHRRNYPNDQAERSLSAKCNASIDERDPSRPLESADSAANPKLAPHCRESDCELRVQSGTRIIELPVSFDSEARSGASREIGRTSESRHLREYILDYFPIHIAAYIASLNMFLADASLITNLVHTIDKAARASTVMPAATIGTAAERLTHLESDHADENAHDARRLHDRQCCIPRSG